MSVKKRDRVAMEARRLQGAKLLKKGMNPNQVAQLLGVTHQSVGVWKKRLEIGGVHLLKRGVSWKKDS